MTISIYNRILLIVALIVIGQNIFAQKENETYYSINDFKNVLKIDAHMHFNEHISSWIKKANEDKFMMVTINVGSAYMRPIIKQRDLAIKQLAMYPMNVAFITTFLMDSWDEPDWQTNTINYLQESVEKGAIAVKVWKNIGMSFKDKEDNYIMIDDPKFTPIFEYLIKNELPLVGHIGEPKSCWIPLDEMALESDKAYFSIHPKFHMYLHPENPSYQELINARDNVLKNFPSLNFIGCHLGSLEWSVDELGKRFEEYPNFAVDMAERVCYLQLQSQMNRKKIRDFMIKYQDRLIYGSDFGSSITKGYSEKESIEQMEIRWIEAWKYFATDEEMATPEFEGTFKGLKLAREVVDKIFRINAEKWFPKLNQHK